MQWRSASESIGMVCFILGYGVPVTSTGRKFVCIHIAHILQIK